MPVFAGLVAAVAAAVTGAARLGLFGFDGSK